MNLGDALWHPNVKAFRELYGRPPTSAEARQWLQNLRDGVAFVCPRDAASLVEALTLIGSLDANVRGPTVPAPAPAPAPAQQPSRPPELTPGQLEALKQKQWIAKCEREEKQKREQRSRDFDDVLRGAQSQSPADRVEHSDGHLGLPDDLDQYTEKAFGRSCADPNFQQEHQSTLRKDYDYKVFCDIYKRDSPEHYRRYCTTGLPFGMSKKTCEVARNVGAGGVGLIVGAPVALLASRVLPPKFAAAVGTVVGSVTGDAVNGLTYDWCEADLSEPRLPINIFQEHYPEGRGTILTNIPMPPLDLNEET